MNDDFDETPEPEGFLALDLPVQRTLDTFRKNLQDRSRIFQDRHTTPSPGVLTMGSQGRGAPHRSAASWIPICMLVSLAAEASRHRLSSVQPP